jgi:hypothetical protein
VANGLSWVALCLNPAIWEAIAGTRGGQESERRKRTEKDNAEAQRYAERGRSCWI